MKLFKNTLAIAALFTIGSVCARNTSAKKAAPVKKAAPAKKTPAPRRGTKPAAAPAQPAPSAGTYQQLRAQVLGMRQADVIDNTKKLSNQFIGKMTQAAADAGLDSIGLTMILQTARDKFVPFTGNDNTDLKLLNDINAQINVAVNSL